MTLVAMGVFIVRHYVLIGQVCVALKQKKTLEG